MGNALPYGLGAAAIIAVTVWTAKQLLGPMLTEAGKGFAGRLARVVVLGVQFRRYRRWVGEHTRRSPGFGPEGSAIEVRDGYVPLQYVTGGRREDIYATIRDRPRTVITGPAGAGKSLLLKHSMLLWADGAPDERRVPVLIELHRCNSDGADVLDLIAAVFQRAGVRRPRAFAEKALRKGRLRLLCDGLDEVGPETRDVVTRALRDFAQRYGTCQIVVTCRDAVYRGQFGAEFTVVGIAEFDDGAVRRLLRAWPEIGPKEAEELFATLRETPQLMRLARSPLLLTMVAYLYVGPLFKVARNLPRTRATFYDLALKHLIDRDDVLGRGGAPLVRYRMNEKHAVLKRLALATQDAARRGSRDRTAIGDRDAIACVTEALADVNRGPEHARPMLDEIVERSQLMVAAGEGSPHFVFTHLTLQEYLAALALDGRRDEVIDHYQADPDAWREVVKLWCATATTDCTPLVRELAAGTPADRILALECLAESGQVDGAYADRLLGEFLRTLAIADAPVAGALGAVLAAGGPRGGTVLAGLEPWLRYGGTERATAMHVLAASGRQDAAEMLAGLAETSSDARTALRSMGELAIPVLRLRAEGGDEEAVHDLAAIRTPAAAAALVPLLDSPVEVAAAWRLAALLRDPDVEEELRQTDPGFADESHLWVWRPFAAGPNDHLTVVAGRIVELLDGAPDHSAPADLGELDSRIALPALALGAQRAWGRSDSAGAEIASRMNEMVRHYRDPAGLADLEDIFSIAASDEPDPTAREMVRGVIESALPRGAHRSIADHLAWPVRVHAIHVLTRPLDLSRLRRAWTAVHERPREPRALQGAVAVLVVLLGGGLVGAGLYGQAQPGGDVFGRWTEWLSWQWYIGSTLTLLAVGALTVAVLLSEADEKALPGMGILAGIVGLLVLPVDTVHDASKGAARLAAHLGWPITAGGIAATAATIGLAGWQAHRRAVSLRNPFRYCLEADSAAAFNRTSILAPQQPRRRAPR